MVDLFMTFSVTDRNFFPQRILFPERFIDCFKYLFILGLIRKYPGEGTAVLTSMDYTQSKQNVHIKSSCEVSQTFNDPGG